MGAAQGDEDEDAAAAASLEAVLLLRLIDSTQKQFGEYQRVSSVMHKFSRHNALPGVWGVGCGVWGVGGVGCWGWGLGVGWGCGGGGCATAIVL